MWTNDQLSAINTTDKAVIVSAAAGSGKTAVLIERTIRLLTDSENKIPADKLLAVTFTNDAAAQMREKLSSALRKKIEENPTDEWLQNQQMKLEMARISTINSFCLDFVKNNINNFDISGAIRILDDTETQTMLEKAIQDTMEYFYGEKKEAMSTLNDCFCVGNDSNLVEIIKELYKFSRSLPFKDSWFENALSNFDNNKDMQNEWLEIINSQISKIMESVVSLYNQAIDLAKKLQFHSKTFEVISGDDSIISYVNSSVETKNWEEISKCLQGIKFKSFSRKLDKNAPSTSTIEDNIVEKIDVLRKSYKNQLNEISECIKYNDSQIEKDFEKSKLVFKYLIEIVNGVWDNMWEQKVAKNAVDFSDVELMSIQLLCEETEDGYKKTQLAKSIADGDEYRIILIDEYQDSNNLQDIIFKTLSLNETNEIIGKNMFVVGDIKQSIYRFRQANPKIFAKTRNDAHKKEYEGIIQEVKLKKNFRSRKGVIDFVNFIFKNIMSSEMGQVEYNQDEALDCGAEYSQRDTDTEILLFDDKNVVDGEKVSPTEAEAVAMRIKQLIDEKYPVYEDGKDRPCRQSDFCILLRNNTKTKDYVNALGSIGLSSQSVEMTGYLKSREISVLLNVLRVIDNPMNDIAFASVLLSPIFMFSADDLAIIKNKSTYKKLYPAFISAIGEGINKERTITLPPELTEKCRKVVDKIKELRFYSGSFPLEQLIRKIYDSTGFFAVTSVYEDAKQKHANLLLLLEYANSYDNNLKAGLAGFIRYINSVFDNNGDLKQAGTSLSYQDSVIIKTIHKSKGLEFPFVFLCGTSTEFTKTKGDLNKPMLINLYKGVGFKFNESKKHISYSTLAHDAIKCVNETEILSEEMRLLYVALTRAKERLFISYKISDKIINNITKSYELITSFSGVTPYIVKSVNSMQGWISLALLMYEGDRKLYTYFEDMDNKPSFPTEAVIKFVDSKDFKKEALDTDFKDDCVELLPDENLVSEIKKYINFEYDNTLADTQSKLSVSEIAKQDTSLKFFYQIPKLDENIGELSAAEKGTATHNFMEYADYQKASENVSDEIERLVSAGLITKKQGSAIDKSSLEAFFNSSFYERIKASDNVMREKKFLVMISDLAIEDEILLKYKNTEGMLQGIADCIFEEDDGFVLVDYKTDNVQSVDDLIEHYTLQLKLYKYAFELILKKPVKSSYIYSFKLKKGVEIDL